jgi:XTP/dITP diphosphohydrolase
MDRVHRDLGATAAKDLTANFTCALALAAPDGKSEVFEGKVFGSITWPPRGNRGFGYDPIFVPEGFSETFGEMEPRLKDSISHRARAFEKLMIAAYDDD